MRYLACGLAAGALAAGTLAMASSAPASAATSCQVAYSTNDWSTGFTASITITNQGTALTAWTLTYSYAG
ncbi:MAG TPA: cellulose binding domain-containing protein, partial [Streptosporangiaceae bacterium]